MVNNFSPASTAYPLETMPEPVTSAPTKVHFPSVPTGLKFLRLKLQLQAALSADWAFRSAWHLFTTPRRLPVKAWEASVLAEARGQTVQASSGRVAYYEWNATGKRTVLLVHGWEHRASFWGHLAADLVAAGYRVVALDGPAHGASAGRRANLVSFGEAVQVVANVIGPVYGVVAHSFGAACTAGMPVHFRQPDESKLPRLVLMSVPSITRNIAELADLLRLPDRVVARIGSFIQQQFNRSVESFNLVETGRHLPVQRALLLHDRQDPNASFTDAEAIAANWPALDFRPTSGLGHNRIMRDPAVLRQVVEFLS